MSKEGWKGDRLVARYRSVLLPEEEDFSFRQRSLVAMWIGGVALFDARYDEVEEDEEADDEQPNRPWKSERSSISS